MFFDKAFNVVFCVAWSVVWYLNACFSSLITSVGEGRAVFFSDIDYSYFCCFCSKEFLFLSVRGKRYVILFWHSMGLPYNLFS